MARLTKEDRERRREWNKERLHKNAAIGTLGKVQHAALLVLSTYRHRMHVASEEFYEGSIEADKIRLFFTGPCSIMLLQAQLPPLCCDFSFDIPDRKEARHLKAGDCRRKEYRAVCSAYIERLNGEIEAYLRDIDRKYGTWYAPCGRSRGGAA